MRGGGRFHLNNVASLVPPPERNLDPDSAPKETFSSAPTSRLKVRQEGSEPRELVGVMQKHSEVAEERRDSGSMLEF